MGILSYVKYYLWTNKTDQGALKIAQQMADYVLNWTLTTNNGAWPNYPRSTGICIFLFLFVWKFL
jgi:hypothetical protein